VQEVHGGAAAIQTGDDPADANRPVGHHRCATRRVDADITVGERIGRRRVGGRVRR
jgi:hypothetical protein